MFHLLMAGDGQQKTPSEPAGLISISRQLQLARISIVIPRYGRFFRFHEHDAESSHAQNMAQDRVPVKMQQQYVHGCFGDAIGEDSC
jgi:hypothetical protein